MKINPNQTTLSLCYDFYKYITDDVWAIVITDVLLRRDITKSEKSKESATTNLTLQTMSLVSCDTITKQCVLDCLPLVVGSKLHIVRMEPHAKEELTLYLASQDVGSHQEPTSPKSYVKAHL